MKVPEPEILLERGAVLVLNKPGGLLTQGPPGIDSLELRVKVWLKEREKKPGKVYLGVPHRLDRPVSGVMVMVKNVRAAQRISQQIEARSVTKTYWAVVEGRVAEDDDTWTDWMRKIPDEPKSEIVAADHVDAKQAILHFNVLGRADDRTWLEIQLETGRTHQIRLQCAARGFPILGDTMYGATTTFGPTTMDLRKQWIALHARRLAFEHPIDQEPVDVTAALCEHWRALDDFSDALFAT